MDELDKKLDALLKAILKPGNEFDGAFMNRIHEEQGRPFSGDPVGVANARVLVKGYLEQAFKDAGWSEPDA